MNKITLEDKFEIITLGQASVFHMFLEKNKINLDPEYQRESDVWPLSKKQLFIDSILNGYDIPKIYFHRNQKNELSIIDGKQRLKTLWDFIKGSFPLASEFVYIRDSKIKIAGKKYSELEKSHPMVISLFNATQLPVVHIKTEDDGTDIIEEIFQRLNSGSTLRAPEFRNAIGGAMAKAIIALEKHSFFKDGRLKYKNTRMAHRDVSAKFLFVSSTFPKQIQSTNKNALDRFVRTHKDKSTEAESLLKKSKVVLDKMSKIFIKEDPLLKSPASIVLYFMLFMKWESSNITRQQLLDFEEAVEQNRQLAENDSPKMRYELLEFHRLSRSPNDASAFAYRLDVLEKDLKLK